MDKDKNLTIEETFNLAVKNHQGNNLEVARDLYNQVLEFNPNLADVHNNLGIIFKQLEENQKAISCFKKAFEINPNFTDAHYNLGNLLKKLGENQKAISCYEKVIKINPNYTDALNNLGIVFENLNEFYKAMNCYEKIIKIYPNHIKAYNNLGKVLKELGESQKAINYFEMAIKIDPNFIEAHNNLGVMFKSLQEIQKAVSYFKKAIEINPNFADAHYNLGDLFVEIEEYEKARDCYEKAIEIVPNSTILTNRISALLQMVEFDHITEVNKKDFKKLFLFLFRKNNNNHKKIAQNAKFLLFSYYEQSQLQESINSNTLLDNKTLQNLLKDELFHLILQKSTISDKFLEKLLTKLRSEILFTVNGLNKDILKEYFNFIFSLSQQAWLNEYIYIQSEKEIVEIDKLKNKVENSNEINELEIAILGSYISLSDSKIIIKKIVNYKSLNILFNDLIILQVKEPLKEIELVKSIISLDVIDDLVSKKVREQYEENPYPRWRFTNKHIPFNFIECLNNDIKPNQINHSNKFKTPSVLIAGCGTGSHAVTATKYKNANILAVDLSLRSLAYAKRKTEELGYKNIEYLHADILKLKKLNRKFDIIESVGTLHHMKDPIDGLKVLLDILEPHGFLKLGLYSEAARQHIVAARELIKRSNLRNVTDDIKNFRQDIINEKVDPLLQTVSRGSDFYSTSSVRDLLFHVQEHRFTIPLISKILKELDLEFLGFTVFYTDGIKKEFSKSFPEDKKNISLDNWHQFEVSNPDTFSTMYQFWVKKK
jgi:tetratricopeptide (TPR) repeat protein